jgi:hypothetical protein
LLLWRDLGGRFTSWHGIASHRILEISARSNLSADAVFPLCHRLANIVGVLM